MSVTPETGYTQHDVSAYVIWRRAHRQDQGHDCACAERHFAESRHA